MSVNHENTRGTEAEGIDEKRRKLLKFTLGGAAGFAAPLIASFSLKGLQAATFTCGFFDFPYFQFQDEATTEIDAAGNLVVTASLADLNRCIGGPPSAVTATADVEAIYGCRTRGGRFPAGIERHQSLIEATVSATDR